MAAKFCANCGGKLDEGAKFCPACGKSLIDVGSTQPTGGELQSEEQGNPTNQQRMAQPLIQPTVQRREGNLVDMLFSFRGRLNRQRYFLRMFCVGMIIGIISSVFSGIGFMVGDLTIILVMTCMSVLVSIPGWVAEIFLMIRRFHDLGKSGWYVLTLIIPLIDIGVILYLLFAPGTAGANEYGDDPLEY